MVRGILLALFCLLLSFGDGRAVAQPVPPSSARFDAAFAELRPRVVGDPDAVLAASGRLESLADPRDPAQGAAVAWLRAEAHARRDEAAAALVEVNRGLAMVRGRGAAIEGDLLRTRGDLATDDGRLAAALAEYQKAFDVYRRHDDVRGRALALTSIASLYRQGGDFDSALRYLGQALAIGGDALLRVSILNNRGNVLNEMGRDREAVQDFRRALTLAGGTHDSRIIARIWRNLARSQIAVNDFDAARASVARGLALAAPDDSRHATDALLSMSARIAVALGRGAEGVRLIERVFAGVDLTTTTLADRDDHRNAYRVYAATGHPEQALRHLEALVRLDDQVARAATLAKVALMSARFDFQNQELRIAGLKQNELRQRVAFERSQARLERILFAIGAGGVAIVIAILSVGIVTLRRSRDEVRAANIELGATNAALAKALKARTDFLATTSHEIRTPLNGILGMTQVMLADGAVGGATRDRLSVVQGAGLAMRALVDDILDVAKMESGNLTVTLAPTDPAAVLRDVARLWCGQAEERGLSFVLAIDGLPGWIESDAGRLRQIVYNLLSNALKFTTAGEIALRAGTVGDRLRIVVSDTGIGIAADRRDEVFESFRQADTSTTRHYGGTGLGLTICRNLARALGGDVLLDSAEGRGSTFTVDLPLRAVAAPPGVEGGGDACAVVILERHPIARGKLRELFAGQGVSPRFVANVEELVAAVGGGGVLIDLATLNGMAGDPAAALHRIAARLRAVDAAGVLLAGADDPVPDGVVPLRVLRKPVSGAKLFRILLDLGTATTVPTAPCIRSAAAR